MKISRAAPNSYTFQGHHLFEKDVMIKKSAVKNEYSGNMTSARKGRMTSRGSWAKFLRKLKVEKIQILMNSNEYERLQKITGVQSFELIEIRE